MIVSDSVDAQEESVLVLLVCVCGVWRRVVGCWGVVRVVRDVLYSQVLGEPLGVGR